MKKMYVAPITEATMILGESLLTTVSPTGDTGIKTGTDDGSGPGAREGVFIESWEEEE